MKKLLTIATLGLTMAAFSAPAMSADPKGKSKFYDFSDQLIDGEIRKPTTLYSNVRQEARFTRLLNLKKELLPLIFHARKERVFK